MTAAADVPDCRAQEHRRFALDVIDELRRDGPVSDECVILMAVTHAVLAVEARLEELGWAAVGTTDR